MKKILLAGAAVVIVAGAAVWWQFGRKESKPITSFKECVAAGNQIMESYPRQCKTKDGRTFVENVPSLPVLPAEGESPVAGICAESREENMIRVEVNQDVPLPRCQKVAAGKYLTVKNNTNEMLSMWFGKTRKYSFDVPAGGEYTVSQALDEILAPGIHMLYGSPYQGPEIWLVK